MSVHNFRDHRETDAGSAGLGGVERFEDARALSVWHSRAVVGDRDLQCTAGSGRSAAPKTETGPVPRSDGDPGSLTSALGRLDAILHQVQARFVQVVRVDFDLGQRWIENLFELCPLPEASAGEAHYAIEHLVHVDVAKLGAEEGLER